MEQVFLTVLNMSITASYVILFVLLVRIFLKKAPKIFSYSLWSVVLFRLIVPFSFSSALSFFNFFKADTMEYIPANMGYMTQPKVNVGINAVDNLVNNSLPMATVENSANPMQIIIFLLSRVWIIGVIGLFIYSVVSYVRLKRKVSTAMLISDNILECEKIKSPFVLGIITPKIYLPISLTENERGYILMHEQEHIKRFDYIIKPFAFLVLCFHWFNPLVWISFVLMSHDMEMSCDESVLKKMGKNIKKDYSSSLLALAVDRKLINGSPLAFGENNAKGRIKNVLNYKEPAFWVIAAAVVLVMVFGIGFVANPKNNKQDSSFLNTNNADSSLIANETKAPSDIKNLVEDNLANIMSSPLESSNPNDYIKANQNAYEDILKYGGEDALSYMLSEFTKGNVENDLRGQIMMRLCIELLGQRNNVANETLSPNEWFSQLNIRQKIDLPDFTYDGDDPIKKLVYSTEIEKSKGSRGEFTIVASHIFGSYEEGNKLKVFVTTVSKNYFLYDKTLSDEGGSIIPAAITYNKNEDGSYTLEKYEQARDGSEFAKSIRKFCVMPISGKKIKGLADKIFNHYGDYSDIQKLERENLIKHLKKNNQYNVFLYQKHYKKPDELIPLT